MRQPVCVASGCWSPGNLVVAGVVLCAPHLKAVEAALTPSGDVQVRPSVVDSIVYYMTFDRGETVKIGTSTNPQARFNSLAHRERVPGQLLAAEPGHYKHERALHARFAHLAIVRRQRREFFRMDDELAAHLAAVREANPDWRDLSESVSKRRRSA